MNPKCQRQLANLEIAKMALCDNLHVHSLNATARAHLDRALEHIREAVIATDGGGNARSVEELTRQLAGMERFLEFLARPHTFPLYGHFWQSGQNGV